MQNADLKAVSYFPLSQWWPCSLGLNTSFPERSDRDSMTQSVIINIDVAGVRQGCHFINAFAFGFVTNVAGEECLEAQELWQG